MPAVDWLAVLRSEYLDNFIKNGGAAIKFVVPGEPDQRQALLGGLRETSRQGGYLFVSVDAATTRAHRLDSLCHEVARQIDWDHLAYTFLDHTLSESQYRTPGSPEEFSLASLAALNGLDLGNMRAVINKRLQDRLYSDYSMTHPFRMAMLKLCQAQLDPLDLRRGVVEAVRQWLRGELQLISALKSVSIFQKIGHHNGRDILSSMSHWFRITGNSGLIMTLDISRFLEDKSPDDPEGVLSYSASAVLDGYEVLRQFIDRTDEIQNFLMVVLAPPSFLTDESRGVRRYDALYFRIWDEVSDRQRSNPLASLIKNHSATVDCALRSDSASTGDPAARISNWRAIEALRAGVPNRDAIRALGSSQPLVEERFRQMLADMEEGFPLGASPQGILLAGDFGSGKSHLLEYLQHVALERNFVCSKVIVSKETPLYDPAKMYAAAIQAARVPGQKGAALPAIAGGLDQSSPAYQRFHRWVTSEEANLSPRFPASVRVFDLGNGSRYPDVSDRIIQFWEGNPVPDSEFRSWLRELGEAAGYKFDKAPARELALQRYRFVSQLMVAAGYAGWIILVDEVELIGRYSLKQRSKSYAEIARWLGALAAEDQVPGLGTVLAITSAFQSEVMDEKRDEEKIAETLRAGGKKEELLLADQAQTGMSQIREIPRNRMVLDDVADIQGIVEKSRSAYSLAYEWDTPTEYATNNTWRIRQHLKRWINEWDLRRLYPDYTPNVEVQELRQSYSEDRSLEIPAYEEDDEDDAEE